MFKWYLIILVAAIAGGWVVYPVVYPVLTVYVSEGKIPEIDWSELKPGFLTSSSDGIDGGSREGTKPQVIAPGDNRFAGLVVIQGDKKSGSGFIAKPQGSYYVVTTQTLLSGNRKLSIFDTKGNTFRGTKMLAAKHSDLAMIEMDSPPAKLPFFAIMEKSGNASAQDSVLIPGSATAGGTTKLIPGKLLGGEAAYFAISNKVFPRHLGAPIYHEKSLSVLGALTKVTSVSIANVNAQAMATGDGRLEFAESFVCARIDAANGWEKIEWNGFQTASSDLKKAREEVATLFEFLFGSGNYQGSEALTQAVKDVRARVLARPTMSRQDKVKNVEALLRTARSIANSSVEKVRNGRPYYIHRKVLDDLSTVLGRMDSGFKLSDDLIDGKASLLGLRL